MHANVRSTSMAMPMRMAIAALVMAGALAASARAAEDRSTDVDTAVPMATCGPGSQPETGLQGQVPLVDRLNGRSQAGYSCNLEMVGQFQGEGSSAVSAVGGRCAYMATSYAGRERKRLQGVQVIDVANPSRPRWVRSLTTRAFALGTWESLKVNDAGTMLAGAGAGGGLGVGKFDLYDITDCANPKLLNQADTGDSLSAIDVSNPVKPKSIYFGGSSVFVNHGMSFNEDGTRMYLASIFSAGLVILDVSDVQQRKAFNRRVRQISKVTWQDGTATQLALPATIQGRPYLIAIDEIGAQGLGGGIRVFDIRDPLKPKEVAYFNPPAQTGKNAQLPGSDHAVLPTFGTILDNRITDPALLAMQASNSKLPDLTADWCSSAPKFVNGQLWTTCTDNGFMVLRFTNDAYPFKR